jgi:hypothetical protein
MQYKTLRKISTIVLTFSLLLTLFFAILGIGCGGILNRLDQDLEEMKTLEREGSLSLSSWINRRETPESVQNSEELKKYIEKYDKDADSLGIAILFFLGLSIISLSSRIYFGKKVRDIEILGRKTN